jgi:hypothetical protein
MKVIHNLNNILILEFQHGLESTVIEVMNMEMRLIQVVLIVKMVQMKSMKVSHKMKNSMIQKFEHMNES